MKKIKYLLIATVTMCLAIFFTSNIISGASNYYFDYTYSVKLDKTQVQTNEPFSAHVSSEGTCKQPLPAIPNGGTISGKITARLQGKDTVIDLNPGFSMQINEIPGQVGQSFQKEVDVPLVFPEGSQAGKYNVIAQTTGAQFQVFGLTIDASSYLPADPIDVGTIECISKPTPVIQNKITITPSPKISAQSVSNSSLVWLIAGGVAGGIFVLGMILWLTRSHHRR
jgi:hypothetical protein